MNFLQFLKEDTTVIINTKEPANNLKKNNFDNVVQQNINDDTKNDDTKNDDTKNDDTKKDDTKKDDTKKDNQKEKVRSSKLSEKIGHIHDDENDNSIMSLFNKKKKIEKYNFEKIQDNNDNIKQKINNDYKEFTFKAGDYIKVIRPSPKPEGSGYRLCDIYCGYYGMIKKRFRSTNYASVTLDAPNNNPTIHFPIEYLEKVNYE